MRRPRSTGFHTGRHGTLREGVLRQLLTRSSFLHQTLMDLSESGARPSKCSRLQVDKSDSRSSMMLMNFVEEVKRKKPKNYRFHYEWESEFLFTMSGGKCTCLICHATVAISKKSNLRRHFTTMHKQFIAQYPENSSARAMKVVEPVAFRHPLMDTAF
ncbi:uncharacterized protein LOC118201941 [Stegodyphus dumicola]|uniref:uncharacterized protein LOC118201941 n=1 Tax=Stegodyphus dumicola TaxID=202533 RepID=UPI0015A9506D|nr:uncharacterized protein LOC118201941 [Stegodyphus dumicola]